MINVEVGQPVMILVGRWRPGTGPTPGTVAKVGRVWIDVRPDDAPERSAFMHRFRLDTQTDGSKYSSPDRFYTLDQWAEHERLQAAHKFLRSQGIDIRRDSLWWGRDIELADLLRTALPREAAS